MTIKDLYDINKQPNAKGRKTTINITLSELKKNPGKYFDYALTGEVIITRRGERLGRIVSEKNTIHLEKQKAIDALIGSVPFPSEYNNPKYDPDYELLREEAYMDRGLL